MQLRRTNESIRKNIEEKLNRWSKYRKKLIGSESEESLTFSDSSDWPNHNIFHTNKWKYTCINLCIWGFLPFSSHLSLFSPSLALSRGMNKSNRCLRSLLKPSYRTSHSNWVPKILLLTVSYRKIHILPQRSNIFNFVPDGNDKSNLNRLLSGRKPKRRYQTNILSPSSCSRANP